MKKTIIAVIIILILIPSYIVLINLEFEQLLSAPNSSTIQENEGTHQKVSMSDSVSITIKRERWYGEIIINSDQFGNTDNLYLFKIIKLPLNKNGFSFVWIHILIIIFSFIIFAIALIWDIFGGKRSQKESEQEEYYYI